MNLVCLSLSPHPKPELRGCSWSCSSAQQARGASRLEEYMSCQLFYFQEGGLAPAHRKPTSPMWNLHSHHHRNIPGAHGNLCSLLNIPRPGRHLFSGHSTWVQMCARTFLLGRTLAASFVQKGSQRDFCRLGFSQAQAWRKEKQQHLWG